MGIILSFTSFPKRISNIRCVVESLKKQTVRADKIVLYLATEEFPNKKLPDNLYDIIDSEFEIHWCDENLLSHKKYYYAMKEYPDDIIITIDDDIIYRDTLIEELLYGYKKNPGCIIARRGSAITVGEDHGIAPYLDWYPMPAGYTNSPRMDLFATGGAGALYPPHVLGERVFDANLFFSSCRYADDIWLKLVETMNNVPVVLVRRYYVDKLINPKEDSGLFQTVNRDGGNDWQLKETALRLGIDVNNSWILPDTVIAKDVARLKHVDYRMWVYDSLKQLNNNSKFSIYGAGKYAIKLYKTLQELGEENRVSCFVVTKTDDSPKHLFGIPVMEFAEQYRKNPFSIYFIGVFDLNQGVIHDYLVENGVNPLNIISMV
jgi:hypothetical protein